MNKKIKQKVYERLDVPRDLTVDRAIEYAIQEMLHYQKTKIPRCSICQKNMKNAVDSITGKISKYEWQTACEHNKNLRLCIG